MIKFKLRYTRNLNLKTITHKNKIKHKGDVRPWIYLYIHIQRMNIEERGSKCIHIYSDDEFFLALAIAVYIGLGWIWTTMQWGVRGWTSKEGTFHFSMCIYKSFGVFRRVVAYIICSAGDEYDRDYKRDGESGKRDEYSWGVSMWDREKCSRDIKGKFFLALWLAVAVATPGSRPLIISRHWESNELQPRNAEISRHMHLFFQCERVYR